MPNARKNQKHRRDQRKADAEQRQARYDALTLDEKIERARAHRSDEPMTRQLARLLEQREAA